jgi:hypothetical protein
MHEKVQKIAVTGERIQEMTERRLAGSVKARKRLE